MGSKISGLIFLYLTFGYERSIPQGAFSHKVLIAVAWSLLVFMFSVSLHTVNLRKHCTRCYKKYLPFVFTLESPAALILPTEF